jgi:hypothetical protein
MTPRTPKEILVDDVLPPGSRVQEQGRIPSSDLATFLARWLDDILRIPGTNFRIGLDPILASIPLVGDIFATGSGLIILLEAARCGVSFPVLLRMGGNMLVNTVLDVIPVVGPVASAFFKSNMRNIRLLQRWQEGQQKAIRKSTFRLFLLLGLLLAALIGFWLTLWFLVYKALYSAISH